MQRGPFLQLPVGRLTLALGLWALMVGCEATEGSSESAAQPVPRTIRQAEAPVPTTVVVHLRDAVGGYRGTRDTYLDATQPSLNFGTQQGLRVAGNSVAPEAATLLHWDLTGLPTDATVLAVDLNLEVLTVTGGGNVFRIYPLQKSWDEAFATWNQHLVATNWSAGGARATADRDFTRVMGAVSPPAGPGAIAVPMADAGVAVVQGWIADPATNLGMVIDDSAVAAGLELYSSEGTNPALHPMLTITANIPPGSLGVNLSDGGLVTLIDGGLYTAPAPAPPDAGGFPPPSDAGSPSAGIDPLSGADAGLSPPAKKGDLKLGPVSLGCSSTASGSALALLLLFPGTLVAALRRRGRSPR